MRRKVYRYSSYGDDFFDDGREHKLPEDYVYIKRDACSKFKSSIIYGIALIYANIYCRLWLNIRIKGAGTLRKEQGGAFIFANHTQPVGDVFTPALAALPKRIYTVVSPANFDLPVIGRLIFSLGALPTPQGLRGMKKFREAVKCRIDEGHAVVIYPEAHVWPYYTGIRPFADGGFTLAEESGAPVYVMTSTYQRSKIRRRPRITVYISGPVIPQGENPRARREALQRKVFDIMSENSKKSTYEYVKYEQTEKSKTDVR